MGETQEVREAGRSTGDSRIHWSKIFSDKRGQMAENPILQQWIYC